MISKAIPTASQVSAVPHALLPRILHSQRNGLPRAYADSSALAHAVTNGDIAVEDVILPWRPEPGIVAQWAGGLSPDDDRIHEGTEHRLLKIHARILALALDPDAKLEPEARVSADRFALRADLLSWSVYGTSQTFECGAVDGRSVLAQLHAGHLRVIVLPFRSLDCPGIRGLAFTLAGNSPLPRLTVENGLRAWAQVLSAAEASPLPRSFAA